VEAKKNAKPVTPYAKYVGAHFAECKTSNPSLTTTEVVKQLAINWKEVSPEDKEQMKKVYTAEVSVVSSAGSAAAEGKPEGNSNVCAQLSDPLPVLSPQSA
jgi:hypothetical protein